MRVAAADVLRGLDERDLPAETRQQLAMTADVARLATSLAAAVLHDQLDRARLLAVELRSVIEQLEAAELAEVG